MMDSETIAQRLRIAVEAVETANVPEDLRDIAFTRALDATLGPVAPPSDPPPVQQGGGGPPASEQTGAGLSVASPMAKLAKHLGIDPVLATQVFDIDEEGLHVALAPSKFSSKVMQAMEEIARLVVAGRQAAGLDAEWTSFNEIRVVCENRGKFSAGNFSACVSKLDGDGFRVRGTGRKKEAKANATGLEKTGQLIVQLAGQE